MGRIEQEQIIEDFAWVADQLRGGEKRLEKYRQDYAQYLKTLTKSQWEAVKSVLLLMEAENQFMPKPLELQRIIKQKIYEATHTKKMTTDFFSGDYCRYCLDAGIISAYEPFHELSDLFHEVAYACQCSRGQRWQLRNYFETYPNFQFSWDRDKNETYMGAYLDGMYAIIDAQRNRKD